MTAPDRIAMETDRVATALGPLLDGLFEEHQEEIIDIATAIVMQRIDEELEHEHVIDLRPLGQEMAERMKRVLTLCIGAAQRVSRNVTSAP